MSRRAMPTGTKPPSYVAGQLLAEERARRGLRFAEAEVISRQEVARRAALLAKARAGDAEAVAELLRVYRVVLL